MMSDFGKAMFWLMRLFVVLVVVIVGGGFLLFDLYGFSTPSAICADDGGVYDYHENRCRFDCKQWTERDGCIPL